MEESDDNFFRHKSHLLNGSSSHLDFGQMHHRPDFASPSRSCEAFEFCRKEFHMDQVGTDDLCRRPQPLCVSSHPLYGFLPAWDSLPSLPVSARHQRLLDQNIKNSTHPPEGLLSSSYPEGLLSSTYHFGAETTAEDADKDQFGPMDCEPAGQSSPAYRSRPGRSFIPGEPLVFSPGTAPRHLAGFGQYWRLICPSTGYLMSPVPAGGATPGPHRLGGLSQSGTGGPTMDMSRESQIYERPASEQNGRVGRHPGLSELQHCYQPVRLPESPVRLPDLAATRIGTTTEPSFRDDTLGAMNHRSSKVSNCLPSILARMIYGNLPFLPTFDLFRVLYPEERKVSTSGNAGMTSYTLKYTVIEFYILLSSAVAVFLTVLKSYSKNSFGTIP
jgi:hypothetical protein